MTIIPPRYTRSKKVVAHPAIPTRSSHILSHNNSRRIVTCLLTNTRRKRLISNLSKLQAPMRDRLLTRCSAPPPPPPPPEDHPHPQQQHHHHQPAGISLTMHLQRTSSQRIPVMQEAIQMIFIGNDKEKKEKKKKKKKKRGVGLGG